MVVRGDLKKVKILRLKEEVPRVGRSLVMCKKWWRNGKRLVRESLRGKKVHIGLVWAGEVILDRKVLSQDLEVLADILLEN